MMKTKASENSIKEVIVIGGGFAGINLVKKLSKNKHYHITLADKNNYNVFQPLVYQVATGFLELSRPTKKLSCLS